MVLENSAIRCAEHNLSMNCNTPSDGHPVRFMSLIRGENVVFYIALEKLQFFNVYSRDWQPMVRPCVTMVAREAINTGMQSNSIYDMRCCI